MKTEYSTTPDRITLYLEKYNDIMHNICYTDNRCKITYYHRGNVFNQTIFLTEPITRVVIDNLKRIIVIKNIYRKI